jgi:hypothetical protein
MQPALDANLARTLIYFAKWVQCSTCGQPCLYVDSQGRTDEPAVCGVCLGEAKRALARGGRRHLRLVAL